MAQRYQKPDPVTKHVFNPLVAALTRLGISVAGSRVLEVRGRRSGEPRRTPGNAPTIAATPSPRPPSGEPPPHAGDLPANQGPPFLRSPRRAKPVVRNLRASGEGRLLVGRR